MDVKYVVPLEPFARARRAAARHPRGARDRRPARVRATARRTSTRRAARVPRPRPAAPAALQVPLARVRRQRPVHLRGQAQGARAAARSSTGWPYDARAARRALRARAARSCASASSAPTGARPSGGLRPALAVAYTRVTLAAPELGERADVRLRPRLPRARRRRGRLAAGARDRREQVAARQRGRPTACCARSARGPADGCSKYCLGVALHAARRARATACGRCCARHFRAAPVAAVALALTRRGGCRPTSRRSRIDGEEADPRRPEGPGPAQRSAAGTYQRRHRAARLSPRSAFAKKPYAIETDKRRAAARACRARTTGT